MSANSDETIGKLISQAMEKVEKEGAITVEEAKSMETTLELVEGMQFDRGYESSYEAMIAEKPEEEKESAMPPGGAMDITDQMVQPFK